MIIKTITCHEVYNYGATLQEYALLQFLKKKGFDASVIHYKPAYLSGHFSLNAVSNPKFNKPLVKQLYLLAKFPGRLKSLRRKKAFDAFHKEYIPTGTTLYRSNEDLIANSPPADAFICGSDQIWNSLFQNGKDPAFYLNFVPNTKKKISYAASFAIDQLDEEVKPLVKKNVSRLDAVGVRETSGIRILNELGIDNAVQVLDPVFLLDKKHWELFVLPIKENFVLVYDFDSNPVIKEIALQLKKEKGWKIYSLNQNVDYADKNYWLEGPERFLSLASQSQYTITNSFHAVAFSLLFEKQFVVVNRNEKINTRMRDLTALVQSNNLISTYEDFRNLDTIDYQKVNRILREKKAFSRKFLIENLME